MICPNCNGLGEVDVWEDVTRECQATLERYYEGSGVIPLLRHNSYIVAHLTSRDKGIWNAMPELYRIDRIDDKIMVYRRV